MFMPITNDPECKKNICSTCDPRVCTESIRPLNFFQWKWKKKQLRLIRSVKKRLLLPELADVDFYQSNKKPLLQIGTKLVLKLYFL